MEAPSKGLRKGAWTADEDSLLRRCIDQYGEGKWHQVPTRAGLNRCRKSCRLRWLNYLKPNIKRGKLSSDEVDLLLRLHKLLGNRWSLIAGRLPGRTANDVKNYWNTHLSKKEGSSSKTKTRKKDTTSNCVITPTTKIDVIKPRPRSFVNNNGCSRLDVPSEVNISPHCPAEDELNNNNNNNDHNNINNNVCEDEVVNKESMWWESLLEETEEENGVKPDGALTEKMTEKSCLMKSTCASFDVDQLWSLFDRESEDLTL